MRRWDASGPGGRGRRRGRRDNRCSERPVERSETAPRALNPPLGSDGGAPSSRSEDRGSPSFRARNCRKEGAVVECGRRRAARSVQSEGRVSKEGSEGRTGGGGGEGAGAHRSRSCPASAVKGIFSWSDMLRHLAARADMMALGFCAGGGERPDERGRRAAKIARPPHLATRGLTGKLAHALVLHEERKRRARALGRLWGTPDHVIHDGRLEWALLRGHAACAANGGRSPSQRLEDCTAEHYRDSDGGWLG